MNEIRTYKRFSELSRIDSETEQTPRQTRKKKASSPLDNNMTNKKACIIDLSDDESDLSTDTEQSDIGAGVNTTVIVDSGNTGHSARNPQTPPPANTAMTLQPSPVVTIERTATSSQQTAANAEGETQNEDNNEH